MSATIGNLNEIATFLKADVYTRNFRPVELKEYVKCGSEIFAIDPSAQSTEEAFTSERTVDFGVSIMHFFGLFMHLLCHNFISLVQGRGITIGS